MPKLYNFTRLITKYSVQFTLISTADGSYVDGKYVEGATTETALTGAIVPYSDSKIYQSGGFFTQKDRELYMKTPINAPLKAAKVKYKGDIFKVESNRDYGDYADAYIYSLKWVEHLSSGTEGTGT